MTKRKSQRHGCSLCGASLKTRFSLQRHFAHVHLPELEGRVPSKRDPRPDEVLAAVLAKDKAASASTSTNPRKRRRGSAAAASAVLESSSQSSSSFSISTSSKSKGKSKGKKDKVPETEESGRARAKEVASLLEPKGGWTRCPECGVAFVTASDVRAHVRRDHLGLYVGAGAGLGGEGREEELVASCA